MRVPSMQFDRRGSLEDLFRQFERPDRGDRNDRNDRGSSQRQYRQQGLGSGVIVDDRGYILTNNHVVAQADKLTVRLSDGRELAAKLIGTDPRSDVAVVKVDASGLFAAKMGSSEDLKIGLASFRENGPGLAKFTGR